MVVATAMGVSAKTVRKWVDRFAAEGASGLAERLLAAASAIPANA
jgi:transposase